MKVRGGSLLVAVALLAACGGGEDVPNDAVAVPTTVASEAKRTFSSEADAVCAEANAERESLQEPGLLSPPWQYARMARYSEALGGIYTDALVELRRLDAPAADVEAVGSILGYFEQAAGTSDEWAEASRARRTSEGTDAYFAWIQAASEGQRLSRDYGFEDCAAFGMP